MKALRIFIVVFLVQINLFGQEKNVTASVSMIQLLSNPEKYDGKAISVSGFLHVKFEDYGLYFSKEQADYLMPESIWVEFDSTFLRKNNLNEYDNCYVELTGIFNKNRNGHMGLYQGTVEQITKVRKLKRWYK